MRIYRVGLLLGTFWLLAACAPRPVVEVRPVPGVRVTVPVTPQGATAVESGKKGAALKVLPGNALPAPGTAWVDDFAKYPTGAVLPVAAPARYGFLRISLEPRFTVVEALNPEGRLDKAVRAGDQNALGFLTTGAEDWTDYRVALRVRVEKAPYTESHVLFRLFMDGTGSRGFELAIGYDGVRLTKLAGEQRLVVLDRKELAGMGRGFLRDGKWHRLVFALSGDGTLKAWLDGALVASWTDPDYRAGGFGVGMGGAVFYFDDLRIERLPGG